MNLEKKSLDRRVFLRGTLAAAVLAPMGASLASCAAGGGGTGGGAQQTGTVSDANPFGVAEGSSVDIVVFDGGYGTEYAEFAANLMNKNLNTKAKVSPSNDISGELQPRFSQQNPPDCFDNSGAKSIGNNIIVDQLSDVMEVFNAKNLEGTVIKDTLYPGAIDSGLLGDKYAQINYVMAVFGLWYSKSLFDENGWTPPTTWDEVIELGAQADSKGKKLFVWGKEAASYYNELLITSAIKQAGDELRLELENLKPNAWKNPAIKAVLEKMKECVDKGYFVPGGSGTGFTQAQAQWSNNQDAILYPSGSWIENEMKDQTKSGFEMQVVAAPIVSSDAKLPDAIHASAGEPFLLPSQAKNLAGGKEFMRVMLSKDAATNFAEKIKSPTIVKDTVPEDEIGRAHV